MELTPIEYLRAQLKRYGDRHGYQTYSSRRLSALLDHLLAEWYDAMPDRVIVASTLQPPAMSRAELVRRYEAAREQDDGTAMASLLPHALKLPKDDPDRLDMLHWCGIHGLWSVSGTVPTLALVAQEELVNAAPQWSLLQFKALLNLGIAYRLAGRFYASYLVFRLAIRHLHAFPGRGLESKVYYHFHLTARCLGKVRTAEHAICMSQQFASEEGAISELAPFTDLCIQQPALAALRPVFQRLWSLGRFHSHLLGGYAMALLQNGYSRAAMAVAQKALAEYQEHYPSELINQVELLALLAAASYRIGRADIGDAFRDRAEQFISSAEVARLVEARIKEWSAQPEVTG